MLRAQVVPVGPLACPEYFEETLADRVHYWLTDEAPWWGCSFVVHLVLISLLALLGQRLLPPAHQGIVEVLESPPPERQLPIKELESDPTGDEPMDVTPEAPFPGLVNRDGDGEGELPLSGDAISETELTVTSNGQGGDGSFRMGERGGLAVLGLGEGFGTTKLESIGLQTGDGGGRNPGMPGDFMHRKYRPRGTGITPKVAERALGALSWLARHQMPDGGWSLTRYSACCKDATCTEPGKLDADSAATAMALLPFLAAGETHLNRSHNSKRIAAGLSWLVRHQKADGDLRSGETMYAHGLASITLCEAYGMTGDRTLGYAAQRAIDFIEKAQNRSTGGWRYQPGEEGDLSVVGWQIMALKSAQMAGLKVDPAVLDRAKKFLLATATHGPGSTASPNSAGGAYAYQPGGPATVAMTSVGLLCSQYLGTPRNDPGMIEGTAYLMRNLPEPAVRDLYYWYYATQVMHNQPGTDWDTWNRKMRRLLTESQQLEGCAAGSWNPRQPVADPWGVRGGRLMMTSLAALTLEVYYRYLPLYKTNAPRL